MELAISPRTFLFTHTEKLAALEHIFTKVVPTGTVYLW